MKTKPVHILQAENELELAEAHGNVDRAAAARKVLAAAGVDVEDAAKKRRRAAEGDDEQSRSTPPQERRAPAKQTAEQPDRPATAEQKTAQEPESKPAKDASPRKRGERLNLG